MNKNKKSMKIEFKNKPNTPHKLPDGKILWESRSVAVVAFIIVKIN